MWIRHHLSSVDPLESLFLLDEEDDVGDGGGEDGGDQGPVHREVAAGGEGGHAVQLPDQVLVLLQHSDAIIELETNLREVWSFTITEGEGLYSLIRALLHLRHYYDILC